MKPETARQARERTAIHEAGHAVIGRALGMTCGSATIVPDDSSAGHAITGDPWQTLGDWESDGISHRDSKSAFRGRIMTLQAGAEAERHFFGASSAADGDDRRETWLAVSEPLPMHYCETRRYQATSSTRC